MKKDLSCITDVMQNCGKICVEIIQTQYLRYLMLAKTVNIIHISMDASVSCKFYVLPMMSPVIK
jgi:hypothetical protein